MSSSDLNGTTGTTEATTETITGTRAGDGSPTDVPRLQARNITVRFGGLVALNDVGIEVPAGAVVGLLGPNGAGKSTLFAVLSGLLRPTAGTVTMNGDDVTTATPQARARRGLARTFQHPELFASLSVREHVMLGHRMRHGRRRIWTDLVNGRAFRKPSSTETDRVDDILARLGLSAIQHQSVLGLPLGRSRLVEVARALATEPSVLLMDEPSSGLDTRETQDLSATLRALVHEHGVSLLLVEHDVPLVLGMCDHVHVLDFGVKIAHGTPAEIREDLAVRAAYLGEEIEQQDASNGALGEKATS